MTIKTTLKCGLNPSRNREKSNVKAATRLPIPYVTRNHDIPHVIFESIKKYFFIVIQNDRSRLR